jgi:hypothetical protein
MVYRDVLVWFVSQSGGSLDSLRLYFSISVDDVERREKIQNVRSDRHFDGHLEAPQLILRQQQQLNSQLLR